MQEGLPIQIAADSQFSNSLKPLLANLEAWINFETLKAGWYGNEDCILTFKFTLIRKLEEQREMLIKESWIMGSGYTYHYDSKSLMTRSLIAVEDLDKSGIGVEEAIKDRLKAVANIIAKERSSFNLI